MKTFLSFLMTVFLAAGAVPVTAAPGGGTADFIALADAVVAVHILEVDFRSTRADGPMVADATVTASLRGEIRSGDRLRFAESAWCGPTHRKGEERILFLKRMETGSGLPPDVSWWTLCPLSGKLDCLLDPGDAAGLTVDAVEEFLGNLESASAKPPLLLASIRGGGKEPLAVEIALLNKSEQPLWLDPSRAWAMAEVDRVGYSGDLEIPGQDRDGWVLLPPGGRVEGVARFGDVRIGRGSRLVLTLGNRAVLYPRRCWTGVLVTPAMRVGPAGIP